MGSFTVISLRWGVWKLWEILLLYSFLLFSEGCINFFFQGTWKIAEMINLADLDRFLVRPLPVGLQLLTARIDFDGLNKMGIAAAVFALGQVTVISGGVCGKFVCLAVVSCGMLCDSCVYDLDCKLCLILDGGREEQFEFALLFPLGRWRNIRWIIYPPVLAGDIRVFDSVCVCQLRILWGIMLERVGCVPG